MAKQPGHNHHSWTMSTPRLCRVYPRLVLLATATCMFLIISKGSFAGQRAWTLSNPVADILTPTVDTSSPVADIVIPTVDTSDPSIRKVHHLIAMPFLIEEPDVCRTIRPNVSLLIYVHSAPANFKNRAQIRKSYGSSQLSRRLGTVTVFVMGRSKDPEVERAVRLESDRYHDIIMADYYDAYHNLTFKAVSALTWITRHCGQVPYVLKTDDDMFLNIFNVVRHVSFLLKYEIDTATNGHIHCKILYSTEPMRGLDAKWYVSEQEYPERNFPLYCSGSAYLMPGFLVPLLHGAIPRVPFLWLDDVYVTGLLRNMTGVIELNKISSVVANTDGEYMSKSTAINGDGLFGHVSGGQGLDLREKYWKEVLEREHVVSGYEDTTSTI